MNVLRRAAELARLFEARIVLTLLGSRAMKWILQSNMIDPAGRGSEILGHFDSPARSFRDQEYIRASAQSKRSLIAGMDI
jgi:hypothetical protein